MAVNWLKFLRVTYSDRYKQQRERVAHALPLNESLGRHGSLSQNVLRYIEETKGQPWLDAKRLELADTYRQAGEELTPAGVDQEIVANACAELFLTNEEAIRRLAREDAGIGGRILNWIQYKLASIKGAFSGETRAESFLRDAERYYIRAFATTGINPAALNVQHMITDPAGISRAAALGWDMPCNMWNRTHRRDILPAPVSNLLMLILLRANCSELQTRLSEGALHRGKQSPTRPP